MEIIVRLDEMMARRKKRLHELAQEVGITEANLSILKNDKAKAIRFSTLAALCKALRCQPGELLAYVESNEPISTSYESQESSVTRFSSQNAHMLIMVSCIVLSYSSFMTAAIHTQVTHKPCALHQLKLDQTASACIVNVSGMLRWMADCILVTRKRVDNGE